MLEIVDAEVMGYRDAWKLQLQTHERVMDGELADGALILLEHPPVVTIGRRPDATKHLLVSPELLAANGVELVETDRGGDITFHGPGQLVVYPIINLNRYNLNLHGYMRLLESVVIETVGGFGIEATRVEGSTGVWVNPFSVKLPAVSDGGVGVECTCANHPYAKLCAIGVKLRRWVTLHGLALNVTTDMSFFEFINPCGLSKPVTSMQRLLQARTPGMGEVKGAVVGAFERRLAGLREAHAEA